MPRAAWLMTRPISNPVGSGRMVDGNTFRLNDALGGTQFLPARSCLVECLPEWGNCLGHACRVPGGEDADEIAILATDSETLS